jgi:hypothetical protein
LGQDDTEEKRDEDPENSAGNPADE